MKPDRRQRDSMKCQLRSWQQKASSWIHCTFGSVRDKQGSGSCTHASVRPTPCTLLLPSQVLGESLKILMPYLAHILSLLALGSRVVDCVRFVCKHDSPDSVATEAHGCAAEDDDGYGRARRQSHDRTAETQAK